MYEELIKALRQMGALTGGLMCVGCGHEHNCGIHGCAIIKAAADALEAQAEEVEQLTKERDELKSDLLSICECPNPFGCVMMLDKWRGPQKEE